MSSNINATFDYPTNFTNGTSIIGIGTMFEYAQYVTEGMFALVILAMIFLMSFVVGIAAGTKKAMASSGFITFIFSVYFWRIGMINPIIMMMCIVIMIIGILGSKSSQGGM